MRLAMARSRSGCTVRSFLPTMYQLGFDFQAVPPTFASNRSGWGDALGRPNELLLLLRKISAEILRTLRTQPDTSIHDFDVGDDLLLRELELLGLRGFIRVRSERADINQPDNAIVGSGAGDHPSAVGVAARANVAAG